MTIDIAGRELGARRGAGRVKGPAFAPSWSTRRIAATLFNRVVAPAAPLLIVLALWQGLCWTGWFPEEILVPPRVVLATAWGAIESGDLGRNLAASLGRLGLGYTLGTVLGIALGAAMGLSRNIEACLGPSFHFLRQLPTVILIPALVMALGVGETIIVVLVAKATAFPVALAVLEGVRGIPRAYRDVAAVFQVRRWQAFRRVILPAILPTLLTGMRIALGRSWMILVAAELLVAQDGIGQMMEWGRQMFRIDVVVLGIILTALLGFGLDRGFRLAERRLGAWQFR